MMKNNLFTERAFDALDEKIYECDHSSGLHIQVIPKKGFNKKFAVITTDFGSVDTEYTRNGVKKTIPDGTAHFLEHKMYEQPDIDVMSRFAALGADCNAATGYSKTYYYFSCTDNFTECLDLLLKHVSEPYFTGENVEKEKGIIIQEIDMYLDDPFYVGGQDLMRLLYHYHPVKNEIAGTEESVRSITPEMLYECHDAFYRPSNMCLTVVGDIDPVTVYDAVERSRLPKKNHDVIIKLLPDEPAEIAGNFYERRMQTSLPIFNFGFKDDPKLYSGRGRMIRKHAGNMAKELIFGSSSELYKTLYERGYINYEFYAAYDIERDYSMFNITGESENIQDVKACIEEYIEHLLKSGVDGRRFRIMKNAMIGSELRSFDSISYIGRIFGQYYLQGVDAFDYFTSCGTITEDDVNNVISDLLSGDMAVSVVERLDVSK